SKPRIFWIRQWLAILARLAGLRSLGLAKPLLACVALKKERRKAKKVLKMVSLKSDQKSNRPARSSARSRLRTVLLRTNAPKNFAAGSRQNCHSLAVVSIRRSWP